MKELPLRLRVLGLLLLVVILDSPLRAQDSLPMEADILAAIDARNVEALGTALKGSDADLDKLFDSHGRTALRFALDIRNVDAVRLLLEAGASPNATNERGSSTPPLSAALHLKDAALVQLLLKHGADLAYRDAAGWTPFEIAFSSDQESLISPLFEAMIAGSCALARIGQADRVIDQALCAAAGAGNTAWCEKLLSAGAAVNAIEERTYTPLIRAVISRNEETVSLILREGGIPFVALNLGTALHQAVGGEPMPGIVRLLLEQYPHGAYELGSYCGTNWVLRKAVQAGHREIVAILIEHGAEPNVPECVHNDLLTEAIRWVKPGSIEALLDGRIIVRPAHLALARELAGHEPTPDRARIVELLAASAIP